ncbi:hypothetical protein [Desulfoluna spongiiphila]|uniref:hypothetical protein n=1 Tax=Desulfoluna spongiiphila TaxID=419481 RepID=UPI0011146063|nr:hypothetical protein [Desulfoluna spongiiphila]
MSKTVHRFSIVVCVLCVCGFGVLNSRLEPSPKRSEDYHLVDLSLPYLSLISLGNESLMADCLWLDLLFRLGESIKNESGTWYLTAYVDAITTLSPSFEGAYELAGTLVPKLTGDFQYTHEVLQKGEIHVSKGNPRYWYILFYLGINAYFGQDDAFLAARYIDAASKFPDTPTFLPVFAASLYTLSDNEFAGLAVVERYLKEFDDPYVLHRLREKQRSLQNKIDVNRHREFMRLIVNPNGSGFLEAIGFE